jgi:hypothetical protein
MNPGPGFHALQVLEIISGLGGFLGFTWFFFKLVFFYFLSFFWSFYFLFFTDCFLLVSPRVRLGSLVSKVNAGSLLFVCFLIF